MQPRRSRRVRCSAWLGRLSVSLRDRICAVMRCVCINASRKLPCRTRAQSVAAESDGRGEVICNRDGKCKRTLVQEPQLIIMRFVLYLTPARPRSLGVHVVTVHASAKEHESDNNQWCEKFHGVRVRPNDPSSATRRTGRNDCNRDAPAGFAAAHG